MKFLFSKTFWNRKRTEKKLDKYNEPNKPFFVLMFFSSLIAALGLVLDSVAVVIGSMMIAPIITPVFGFGLNFLTFQIKDSIKALGIILLGTLVGVISAYLSGLSVEYLAGEEIGKTAQIISRIEPNLLHLMVAVFSGMVGAYAYSTPDLSERIVGIAISVALIPPLATVGIGLAMMEPNVWRNSSLLYLANLAGIISGSMIMFVLLGFGTEAEESVAE
ncbi:MAG: DUF389 domain-containing protein [Candidatus Magasanikbacteria bacterium]